MLNCGIIVNVVQDFPALISMGKSVLDDKMSFAWIAEHSPVLVDQSGNFLFMDVQRNAPEISAEGITGSVNDTTCIADLQKLAGVFPKGGSLRTAKCLATNAVRVETRESSTQTDTAIVALATEENAEKEPEEEKTKNAKAKMVVEDSKEKMKSILKLQEAALHLN